MKAKKLQKPLFAVTALFLIFSAVHTQAQTPTSLAHTGAHGSFSVAVPTVVVTTPTQEFDVPGPEGNIHFTMYTATTATTIAPFYQMQYINSGATGVDTAGNQLYFATFAESAASSLGGVAANITPAWLGGFEGISFTISSNVGELGAINVCSVAYRVGDDVIALMVGTTTECVGDATVDQFLQGLVYVPNVP